MQRCAFPVVNRVDTQPSFQKVSHADWLVTLRRNMNHIYPLPINCENISPMLNKVPNQFYISMKRCEVESAKTVFTSSVQIYVICNFFLPFQTDYYLLRQTTKTQLLLRMLL